MVVPSERRRPEGLGLLRAPHVVEDDEAVLLGEPLLDQLARLERRRVLLPLEKEKLGDFSSRGAKSEVGPVQRSRPLSIRFMASQGGELPPEMPKAPVIRNEYVYSVMADRRVPFIPGGKLQRVGMSAFEAHKPVQLGGRSSEFSSWYTDFIEAGAENDTAKDVSGGKWKKVGRYAALALSLGDDGTVQRRIQTSDGTIWTVSRQIAGKASSSAPNSAYASPAFNRAAAAGGGSGGRGSGGSGGSSGGGVGGGGSGAAAGPSASADEPPTVHRESSLIKSALRLLPHVVVAATLTLPCCGHTPSLPLHGAGVLVLGASEIKFGLQVSAVPILRYAGDDTVGGSLSDLHAFLCKADEQLSEAPHPNQQERHEVMCALLRRLHDGGVTFSFSALEDVVAKRVRGAA